MADVKSRFGVAPVIARCSRSVIEPTPLALANSPSQEWAALRRGGGYDLDPDVSIQTSFIIDAAVLVRLNGCGEQFARAGDILDAGAAGKQAVMANTVLQYDLQQRRFHV